MCNICKWVPGASIHMVAHFPHSHATQQAAGEQLNGCFIEQVTNRTTSEATLQSTKLSCVSSLYNINSIH